MKFPVKFIIAVCALVIGISGIVACVVPYYGPEKVVYQYVKAAADGDLQKMYKCTVAPEISDTLDGTNLEGIIDAGSDLVSSEGLAGLIVSPPADDPKILSMKILGCTLEAGGDYLGVGYEVKALIETVYTVDDGEELEYLSEKTFRLVKTNNGYKIYS
ncbi:MAG: hypothetical protein UIG59_06485 [Acutalibacteraceae bacterium]|nr:hypothetical protein [Acutalibacteraceae bacterium]